VTFALVVVMHTFVQDLGLAVKVFAVADIELQ
jgi:hypothetical protein